MLHVFHYQIYRQRMHVEKWEKGGGEWNLLFSMIIMTHWDLKYNLINKMLIYEG